MPGIEGQTTACVFDCMDPSIFLVADATSWHIMVHTPMHVDGPSVRPISRCDAVPGCTPLTLQEGSLLFQMPSGHISTKQLGFCAAHGYDLDSKVELEYVTKSHLAIDSSARASPLHHLLPQRYSARLEQSFNLYPQSWPFNFLQHCVYLSYLSLGSTAKPGAEASARTLQRTG